MSTDRRCTPQSLVQWIKNITIALVEHGLVDGQNFPLLRRLDKTTIVSFPNSDGARALSQGSYRDLYELQLAEDAYNLRMLDGAIIQLTYEFLGNALLSHRLAFLPSPDLIDYQNNDDLYVGALPFADLVGSHALPAPLRFDYDARKGVPQDLVHPASHLTIGQYQHCRVPVRGPINPAVFLDFVVRHFYTGMELPTISFDFDFASGFRDSITETERGILHLSFRGE